MRTETLLLAATTGVVLASCSTPRYTNPFIDAMEKIGCSATCSIAVVVKEKPDGTCTIDDLIPIETTGANGLRTIKWTIADAAPYKFSDENYKFGLFVKDDPQGKFKKARVTGRGKTLELDFEHRKNAGEPKVIYDYALTVQRNNDTFCVTKDPWLIS